jgi:ABC-type cobalamin transport system permease subunit
VLRKIAAAVSEKIVDMAVGEVARSVDRLVIQRWRWIVATAVALMVVMLALGGVAGYEVLSHTTPCNDQVDGSRVCGWYERRPTHPVAAAPEPTPTTKPTSH